MKFKLKLFEREGSGAPYIIFGYVTLTFLLSKPLGVFLLEKK